VIRAATRIATAMKRAIDINYNFTLEVFLLRARFSLEGILSKH
jgi:hypothetical protein